MALLERAVQTTQLRLIGRVLRNNTAFRRSLAPAALAEGLKHFLPAEEPLRDHGLRVLAEVSGANRRQTDVLTREHCVVCRLIIDPLTPS